MVALFRPSCNLLPERLQDRPIQTTYPREIRESEQAGPLTQFVLSPICVFRGLNLPSLSLFSPVKMQMLH